LPVAARFTTLASAVPARKSARFWKLSTSSKVTLTLIFCDSGISRSMDATPLRDERCSKVSLVTSSERFLTLP
jgi:hypothetical protein